MTKTCRCSHSCRGKGAGMRDWENGISFGIVCIFMLLDFWGNNMGRGFIVYNHDIQVSFFTFSPALFSVAGWRLAVSVVDG